MPNTLKSLGWIAVLTALLLLAACCGPHRAHRQSSRCDNCVFKKTAPCAVETAGQRHDRLYLCDCGPECKCNSMSTQPGNCGCGKAMRGYHVVKTIQDEALLCTCTDDCACAIDAKDTSKCACGKPLKRISLKGSGIYFCNCGGACTCNHLSAQPGSCEKCGMDLIKVD